MRPWRAAENDEAIIEEECSNCGEVADIESEDLGREYVLTCAACGAEIDRLTPGSD